MSFLPAPVRNHTALELSLDGEWRRLRYRASYVFSRSRGNYTGLYSSDTYSSNPGNNNGFVAFYQAANSLGPLPNDIPHVLKLAGVYQAAPSSLGRHLLHVHVGRSAESIWRRSRTVAVVPGAARIDWPTGVQLGPQHPPDVGSSAGTRTFTPGAGPVAHRQPTTAHQARPDTLQLARSIRSPVERESALSRADRVSTTDDGAHRIRDHALINERGTSATDGRPRSGCFKSLKARLAGEIGGRLEHHECQLRLILRDGFLECVECTIFVTGRHPRDRNVGRRDKSHLRHRIELREHQPGAVDVARPAVETSDAGPRVRFTAVSQRSIYGDDRGVALPGVEVEVREVGVRVPQRGVERDRPRVAMMALSRFPAHASR